MVSRVKLFWLGSLWLSSIAFGADLRQSVSLNKDWQIAVVPSLDQNAATPPVLDKVKWEKVEVPYYGAWPYSWWQRDFTVPNSMRGKRIKLRFEGVVTKGIVFVNGKRGGEHLGGRMPFEVDITDKVRVGSPNRMLVGVIDKFKATTFDGVLYQIDDLFVGTANGIWQDVNLVAYPLVYIESIWVKPSTRTKSLGLEITIRNESSETFSGQIANQVLEKGNSVIQFKTETISILASRTEVLKLSYPWATPKLWSPETPNLYHIESRILKDGKVADRLGDRFGFREIWVEGDHLMLNGRRLHMRGDSAQPQAVGPHTRQIRSIAEQIQGLRNPQGIRDWYKGRLLFRKSLGLNYFRHHVNPPTPDFLDIADEVGFFVQPELGWTFGGFGHNDANPEPSIPKLERYTLPIFGEWVRRDRNHPCIVTWGADNEYLMHYISYHANYAGAACNLLIRINSFLKQLDPTRPATFEGSGCLGGSLTDDGSVGPADIICWHAGLRGLSQGYTLYPNIFYNEDLEAPAWSRKKPLWIDEAIDAANDFIPEWDMMTIFQGDKVYEDPSPGSQTWWPDDAKGAIVAQAWADSVRMQMEAWRYLGVSWGNFNYWLRADPGFTSDAAKEVRHITQESAKSCAYLAVLVREYDHNFYSGETITRRATVYNDMFHDAKVVLDWELVRDGKAVETGRVPLSLLSGESKKLTLTLHIPAVETRTPLTFRLKLQEPGTTNRFEDERQFIAFPKEQTPVKTAARFAIYDPEKKSTHMLTTFGVNFTTVPNLADISHEKFDVLILGKGGLPMVVEVPGLEPNPKDQAALKRLRQIEAFTAAGGRVIVLEQENFSPSLLSMNLKAKDLVPATMTFSIAQNHPILKDLQAEDLKFWRGDHVVSSKPLVKPDYGNLTILIESGTGQGLIVTPLCEVKKGKGTIVFCQMDVTQKCGKEPVAGILMHNILTYAAGYSKKALGQAGLMAKAGASPVSFLRDIHAEIKDLKGTLSKTALASYSCLIVDAADPANLTEIQKNIEPVKKYLTDGGRLLVHNLKPDGEGIIESLTGVKPEAEKITQNDCVWKITSHPLLAGISNFELWYGRHDWGCRAQGRKTIDIGWRVPKNRGTNLFQPGGLVVIPCGKGQVIIDQILWEGSDGNALGKRRRYISTLLTNLGVNIEPTGAEKPLYPLDRFFPVDLRPYANMGFKDDVANDGKGGWSDEGNNDLKYFPVGRQLFCGVLFDVIDPALNNGKSCLQTYVAKDRAIKGIKVNRKLEKLFFLYGTTFTITGPGVETAYYEVVYADGQKIKIPIRFKIEVDDWYQAVPESATVVKAWEGDNGFHSPIYITRFEWKNPHPEKEISTVTVALPPVVPFRHGLIALTGLLPGQTAGQTVSILPTGKVNNCRNVKVKGGEISYNRDDPNFNMNDPRAEYQSEKPFDLSSLRKLTFTAEFDEEGWINLVFAVNDGKTVLATHPKQIKAQKGSSDYSIDLTTLKWRIADTDITAKLAGKTKALWISTSQGTGSTVRLRNVILHQLENVAGNTSDAEDPCAQNMKRLGRAMLEYARDHKGRLPSRGPHPQYNRNGVVANAFTNDPDLWSLQILPYLKLPKDDYSVFHCPAVQINGKPLVSGDSAMTYAIVRQTQEGPDGGRMHGRLISEFGDPSKFFLLIEPKGIGLGNIRNAVGNDMYYWNISRVNNASYLDSIDFRHNGKAHFLFVDGHVELLGPDEIGWPVKK